MFAAAADEAASRDCLKIGIIADPQSWEYPVWKMIERRTGTRPEIRHVGVTNDSRKLASDRHRAFRPCAIMTVHYFAHGGIANLQRFFPRGIPVIPPGFTPAWKQKFITLYLPGDA